MPKYIPKIFVRFLDLRTTTLQSPKI